MKTASFLWVCPLCGCEQTEVVTIDGPVVSLICESCAKGFAVDDLPRETQRAWTAAIEDVIPREEEA